MPARPRSASCAWLARVPSRQMAMPVHSLRRQLAPTPLNTQEMRPCRVWRRRGITAAHALKPRCNLRPTTRRSITALASHHTERHHCKSQHSARQCCHAFAARFRRPHRFQWVAASVRLNLARFKAEATATQSVHPRRSPRRLDRATEVCRSSRASCLNATAVAQLSSPRRSLPLRKDDAPSRSHSRLLERLHASAHQELNARRLSRSSRAPSWARTPRCRS